MRIIEIDSLQNEGMDMFRSLTEAQLRNRLYHVERIIKIAIVLVKEGGWLTKETIREADFMARIPISNVTASINVAATCAVAFRKLRQITHLTNNVCLM